MPHLNQLPCHLKSRIHTIEKGPIPRITPARLRYERPATGRYEFYAWDCMIAGVRS